MGELVASDFPFRDLEADDRSPGRPPGDAEPVPAVQITSHDGDFPPLGVLVREIVEPEAGRHLRVWANERGLQWTVGGVGRFWLNPEGTEARYQLQADALESDVEQILLGPVLGIARQSRGGTLLHGSAVLCDGGVAIFCAPGGSGKSTLAAQFGRREHLIVADDAVPLDVSGSRVVATPYVPRLKLWEPSFAAFGEQPDQYDRILSGHGKRRVKPSGRWGAVAPEPAPVVAIYALAPYSPGAVGGDRDVIVDPIPPLEATLYLAANMYMSEIATSERSRAQLRSAALVAERVPIRRLLYQRTFEQLPGLVAAITGDLARSGDEIRS